MANSLQNTRLITPEDTGTIINIIIEIERMKDTYLVMERNRIGEYNTERALEITKNAEFLRAIARDVDEEGKNKNSEQILKEIEKSDRTNSSLNAIIGGITVLALGLGAVFM